MRTSVLLVFLLAPHLIIVFSHLRGSNLVRTNISVFFLLNDYSLSGHKKVLLTCEEHRFSENFS